MVENEASWMIGGAQGSGVESSATIFALACAYGGLRVYGKREYYSNIMGEHSYSLFRVSERPLRSITDEVHVLASFDAETAARHAQEVVKDGAIFYDREAVATRISDIPTIEARFVEDLTRKLREDGLGATVGDALESARRRGAHLYPLPYNDLLKEIAEQFGETKLSKLARMVNVIAVAASLAILKFDTEPVHEAIRTQFKEKPKIAQMNVVAAEKAASYVRDKYSDGFAFSLRKVPTKERRVFLQGFQAIALGKLLGGCRFQTYYPITPASDESVYLEDHEVFPVGDEGSQTSAEGRETVQKNGRANIVVVQTEDEIAAITMATGAALAGARAATATSGPGFSLMAEGMGWAGMNEVPVVITLYQRTGPSTGLPTRHEQGELRFALHAGHGEFPRIVVASGDHEEGFYDAIRCFNYAERYQLPVIHLVDKALANSFSTLPVLDSTRVKIERGAVVTEQELEQLNGNGGYRRFQFSETGISPRGLLGMRDGLFWNTGDEHDERGHITEDPVIRMRMMEKRMGKLEVASQEIPSTEKVNWFGEEDAELTVVSWGSPKGAILDAMDRLSAEGHRIAFLQIRMLSPFPDREVSRYLRNARQLVDVEMNFSAQLAGVVREHTGVYVPHRIVKYNGRPFSEDEVYGGLKQTLKEPLARIVMTHGA